MAIFEVTISGSNVYYDEDLKTVMCLEEATFTFTREGPDLIGVMMSVQAKLDILNEALKEKHPLAFKDGIDWEFKIVGINLTPLIHFNDTWIKEFVEDGVLTRNYEEED